MREWEAAALAAYEGRLAMPPEQMRFRDWARREHGDDRLLMVHKAALPGAPAGFLLLIYPEEGGGPLSEGLREGDDISTKGGDVLIMARAFGILRQEDRVHPGMAIRAEALLPLVRRSIRDALPRKAREAALAAMAEPEAASIGAYVGSSTIHASVRTDAGLARLLAEGFPARLGARLDAMLRPLDPRGYLKDAPTQVLLHSREERDRAMRTRRAARGRPL